jgi:chorismate synthase
MKNVFGNSITITLFGESHGQAVGAVLDGLASGIKIDKEYINSKLALRKPFGKISTSRVENDEFEILSGVFNGYTTGTPLCVVIKNTNAKSGDYSDLKDLPRPSHADYTANIKYNGFQDYRGGGHFSGRITVAIVCACAILQYALEQKGIYIGTHISYLGGLKDKNIDSIEDVKVLSNKTFPVVCEQTEQEMIAKIEQVASEGDSIGGILETCVFGVNAGIGEPWFDSFESMLSHAIFSVPAVKGVEFGAGFGFADMLGSTANDQFKVQDGKIVTETNNNGGINGGISNGMPIVFRCAIKPTPSIFKEQQSVRLSEMKEEILQIKGRHDPAIIHRVRAVIDAITAFTIADLLSVKFGTDYLSK